MKRVALLLFLLGCSGSGATVAESAGELSERPSVEPEKPVAPVDPLTRFECKTAKALSDGAIHVVRFAMRSGELEPGTIDTEPATSVLHPLETASVERNAGKVTLTADGRTELTLFENSDLTRGYVKAAGEYSEIYCTKTR